MSDNIFIRQLSVDAIIGIHDWEKTKPQRLLIDLDLSFDCKKAARSDDINDALDYFEVCKQVTELIKSSRFELIESLAEFICEHILNHFPCRKVKLTLFKPQAVPDAKTVGIRIIRKA